jgi:hypothetical protein
MKYPINTDSGDKLVRLAVELIDTAYLKGLRGEKGGISTWEEFESNLLTDCQPLPSGTVKEFLHVTLEMANDAYEQGRRDTEKPI